MPTLHTSGLRSFSRVSRPLSGLVFVLLLSVSAAQTGPAAATPGAADTTTGTPTKKKQKPAKPKQAENPQAAEINAIVEKHKQQQASARDVALAQLQSLLQAEPHEPAERERWLEKVRAAFEAQRQAAIDADDAMRAELEEVAVRRRPTSKASPAGH